MPFPASAVGHDLPPSRRTLTARDILAYAAGLGAAEPAFLDDAAELRALPFMCVSLEWPVLLSARAAMSGALSEAEARRGVHAIQDSHFHRALRPGDELETRGQLVLARQTHAGVLTAYKLTTVDRRTGAPTVTSWSSSIYRDVSLDGADAAIEHLPHAPVDLQSPLDDGACERTIAIAREAAHIYTECASIWNPIHTERAVALGAGLPDIILHGTATWALAGLEILRTRAGNDMTRLKRFSGRFVGMVIPGEVVGVRHSPAADDANVIRFEVLSVSGAKVIDRGFAAIA